MRVAMLPVADSICMDLAKCRRLRAEQERVILYTDIEPGMSFVHWEDDWSLEGILEICRYLAVQRNKFLYVGVTQSLCWRWQFCGREDGWTPHCGRFNRMYPLCVDGAECVQFLEEHVLETLFQDAEVERQLVNDRQDRPGPINMNLQCSQYACIL